MTMADRHPNTHSCPKHTCGVRVAREKFACRAHWFELPKPLRDEISAAYRHRRADGGQRHRVAMLQGMEHLNGC